MHRVGKANSTIIFYAAVILLAGLSLWQTLSQQDDLQLVPATIEGKDSAAIFSRSFIFDNDEIASVHASAIARVSDEKLLAVWYGGTREGAGDVAIFSSTKNGDGDWVKPRVLINRQDLSQQLGRYIRKLGNPVLLSDGKGRVWLFFVSVSIGGWSTSAINLVTSADAGKTWSTAKRLYSSPFLNLSTLVKARPFLYKDGSIGLPAYHELAGKFSELIHVSAEGKVLGKTRITKGRFSIQPSIVSLGGDRLIALTRNSSSVRKIVRSYGQNAGKNWSEPDFLPLLNPDSAVTMAGNEDLLVLVYNNLNDDRNKLAIAVSTDTGRSWKKRFQLESAGPIEPGHKSEFSYPFLSQDDEGDFYLVYTWQRKRIAYVHFNRAWLEQANE